MAEQMNEEQMSELQEKIKNMSPEELREFQKKQCIFCQIIEGKVQSKKVYEDEQSIAIMDINPANPGHVLLLPKEHYSIMPQLSEDEITHLFNVSKTISNAALRALGVGGTNIVVQNGIAAGQKAQHFMIHIIPRKEGDGVGFDLPQKQMDEKILSEIQAKLTQQMGVTIEDTKTVDAEFSEKESKEGSAPESSELLDSVGSMFDSGQEDEDTPAEEIDAEPEDDSEGDDEEDSDVDASEDDSDESADDDDDENTADESEDDSEEPDTDEDKEESDDVDLDDIAKVLGAK